MKQAIIALILLGLPATSAWADPPPIIPDWAAKSGKSARSLCLASMISYEKRVEWCGALEEWGLRGSFRICVTAATSGGTSWKYFCKIRFGS